ncbi:bifunctional diaminohydroxyphosphoribosylaminopyrimidine deaminase/5-amino-6-(5-phosphoribosylamino)uracil reductase RibD [Betaproteobacteria bacterium LSUCC0115]|nr:bifunctional diaminohydroxyphosphoribosylaminopyrimidine deaminase/5-amino-6-(5-phosphoribosylamino)uracil reductase RibD [Burkholderiales bacterium LSUCC0115]
MFNDQDVTYMRQALELAERGLFTTTPNPRVGCVIVREQQVVGQGWHVRAGEPHAEVHALAEAGEAARGATAYITLEPCSHTGRTGPCSQALIQAGVASVVAAMEDPNPQVSGQGLAQLRAAGIEVRCGLLADEAAALNVGFVARMKRGRAWVRAKSAISLDGYIALPNGQSQWLTDAASRADGHAWRARACAVITGIGTFLKDRPLLTVREVMTSRQPLRMVIDARLQSDPDMPFFHDPAPAMVVCTLDPDQPEVRSRTEQLRGMGVDVVQLPSACGQPGRPMALSALVDLLTERGMNELHLEAGSRMTGAFLQAGLLDEWLIYQAPIFLGSGMPMAEPWTALLGRQGPLAEPSQATRWHRLDAISVGDSLRFRLLRADA